MRFTVELEPLIEMVAMVGERMPRRKQAEAALQLIACAGRVYVESQDTVAETDAAVWEDGQCVVYRGKLLDALKAYRWEANLTILADDRGLYVGQLSMPVSGY